MLWSLLRSHFVLNIQKFGKKFSSITIDSKDIYNDKDIFKNTFFDALFVNDSSKQSHETVCNMHPSRFSFFAK